MNRRTLLTTVVGTTAALALAACGGSEGPTTDPDALQIYSSPVSYTHLTLPTTPYV